MHICADLTDSYDIEICIAGYSLVFYESPHGQFSPHFAESSGEIN